MSNKRPSDRDVRHARYEYRVWGRHSKARKKLARLASNEVEETVKDCYLLVDDSSWNAKIRRNNLKIKQLVSEDQGFERWTSDRHRTADTAPSPFDDLFEQLRLDRPQRGKSYDLYKAIDELDPSSGVRAVFVIKRRRRYTVGALRAEVTDIEVTETSDLLHTLVIEGDDLDELVALRKELGLRDEPNFAVHQAIDPAFDTE